MSIKNQIDEIPIPKNLHTKVKAGIELAQEENKKRTTYPILLTVLVTSALLFLVFSSQNILQVQAASTSSPFIFYYGIALILTILSCCLCIFSMKKIRNRLLFFLLIVTINIVCWNITYQYSHQLKDIYIFPFEASETDDVFTISYMVNKQNPIELQSVMINGTKYDQFISNGYPLVAEERLGRHQVILSKVIYIKDQSIADVFNESKNTATLHFSNGKSYIWDISLYEAKPLLNQYFQLRDFTLSTNKHEAKIVQQFETKETIKVLTWDIPEAFIGQVHAKIEIGNTVLFNDKLTNSSSIPNTVINKGEDVRIQLNALTPLSYAFLYEDYITMRAEQVAIPLLIDHLNDENYFNSIKAIQIRQIGG